jgi:hypothetical protein
MNAACARSTSRSTASRARPERSVTVSDGGCPGRTRTETKADLRADPGSCSAARSARERMICVSHSLGGIDSQSLEAAVAFPRHGPVDRTYIGQHRLGRGAVAAVARPAPGRVVLLIAPRCSVISSVSARLSTAFVTWANNPSRGQCGCDGSSLVVAPVNSSGVVMRPGAGVQLDRAGRGGSAAG